MKISTTIVREFAGANMNRHMGILAVIGTLSLSPTGLADVQSAAESRFTVITSVSVKEQPQAAWEHLLEIGSWWDSSHTWSGDSANLSLSVLPGGGFDEKLDSGGFVRHMSVIYSDPGKMLRITGVLGPLQEHALNGTMTITFTADGGTTMIKTTYHVSGYFPGGLEKIAPLVDKVLTEQFQRLGKVIEGTLPEEVEKPRSENK